MCEYEGFVCGEVCGCAWQEHVYVWLFARVYVCVCGCVRALKQKYIFSEHSRAFMVIRIYKCKNQK